MASPSVKAIIITNKDSEDQDAGSEIKETGKTRLQCKVLEKMIRLLTIPPQNIVVFDISDSAERQFWVATQTGLAYPKYPQAFIGDEPAGSLSELEADPQKISSLVAKDKECTVLLVGADKRGSCAPTGIMTPLQELKPIRKWCTAKELSGILASTNEESIQKEAALLSKDNGEASDRKPPAKKGVGLSGAASAGGGYERIGSMLLSSDEFAQVVVGLPTVLLSQVVFASIAQSRADVIKKMLASNVSLVDLVDDEWSPLEAACIRGSSLEIVDILVGLPYMTVKCYPLIQRICSVCSDFYDAVVQKLFDAGKISLEAEIPDKKTGQTVFHLLCRAQNVSLLRIFTTQLKKDFPPEKARAMLDVIDKKRGRAVLHTAASVGNSEMVQLLLDAGATPDIVECTPRKRTPLHFACESATPEVVSLLLKAGANVNALLGDEQTALHLAAAAGFVPVVEALLEASPVLDAKDKNGLTPLHIAAANRKAAVIACLGATGKPIGVNVENSVGRTPLQIASKEGFGDVVSALISAGASVNLADIVGVTPLYVAASEGFEDVVDMLVAAGAKIEAADKNGITPLYAAVLQGRTNIVGKLLTLHANAEVCDVMGTTPLSVAAQGGHSDIVRLLLKAGVSPNSIDKEGWTPLRWACQQGHFPIVLQLVEAGADIAGSISGGTPGGNGADFYTEAMAFVCSFGSSYRVNAVCDAMLRRKRIRRGPAAARPQVHSIDLSGRGIAALPRLFHTLAPGVTEINADNNLLTSIPSEYAILKDMRFRGNPLDATPRASAWSWSKMRALLQSVAGRAAAWWEFRTFVVGPPGSGKKSLVHCLNDRHAGKDAFKKSVPAKGVAEYHDYFADFKGDKTNCVCNVFCIAEETPIQAKVLALLAQPQAKGAAFLVCCNITDPSRFWEVDELMNAIGFIPATPPVVIVLTHVDGCNPETVRTRTEEFRTKYAPRAQVVNLSCKDGTGVSELRGLILGPVGTRFGTRSTPIPPQWIMLYDLIQRNQARVCVEWDEFAGWAKQCGISTGEDNELEDVAAFLASSGLIACRSAAAGNGSRHVVLSPQWLGTVVAAVNSIRFDANAHSASLVPLIAVDEGDNRVLSNPSFLGGSGQVVLPGPVVPGLLSVLEEFCVWYRITLGARDYVLPPALFPQELSALQHKKLSELWAPQISYPTLEHRRVLKFPVFPPAGVAEQLVVRVLRVKGVVPDIVWGRGALVHTERETALVMFDPAGQSATCAVRYSVASSSVPVDGVTICTISSLLEDILAAITSHLRIVCPSMCGAGMQQIVVCSHCIQERPVHADPLAFSLSQCETFALLQCPLDKSVFVRSEYVAPDVEETALQIPEDKVEGATPVGIGSFGLVFKALYKSYGGDKSVLISTARLRSSNPRVLKDFSRRVRTVCSLSHPRIARAIGSVATSSSSPFVRLVYEGGEIQPLRSFLLETSKSSERRLSIGAALRLASEVAEGMTYLHKSVFPPLVHGGLSSYSVFVTPDMHAKIVDVGIRDFFLPVPNCGGNEAWRWKAPDPPPALPTGDVYSFGVLLWELVSPPAFPYEEYSIDHTLASLRVAIKEGLRPAISPCIPLHVKELIQACWDQTPSARPTFDVIGPYLARIIDEISAAAAAAGGSSACVPQQLQLPSLKPSRKEFFSPVTSTDTLVENEDPPTTLSQSMGLRASYRSFAKIEQNLVLMFMPDGSFSVNDSRGNEQKRVPYVGNAYMTAISELSGCLLVARSDGTLTTYAKVSYLQIVSTAAPDVITSLYTDSDSKYVWGGTRSGTLILWNVASFPGFIKVENVLTVHEKCKGKPVTSIVRHGNMIIAAIGDTMYSFSLDTGKPLFVWPAHVGGITSIASMPPNVWSGTSAGEVWMWSLPQELPTTQNEFDMSVKCTHNRVFYDSVTKVVAVPNSQQVWSITKKRIVLWDALTARPIQSLVLPPSEMRNLYIVPFLMTDENMDSTVGGNEGGGNNNNGGSGAKPSGRRKEKRQFGILDGIVVGKTVWTLCENNFAYIWKNPDITK